MEPAAERREHAGVVDRGLAEMEAAMEPAAERREHVLDQHRVDELGHTAMEPPLNGGSMSHAPRSSAPT